MLPDFCRPWYKSILEKESTELVDASTIFRIWSLEGEEKYYRIINNALLSDNYVVLNKYKSFINDLRKAIKQNPLQESVTVYRGLRLDPKYVQCEYKIGKLFLWPTLSSTSRNKDITSKFGNYTFEINISTKDGYTYCADISQYSKYPKEQEVLIYPYSGFRVRNILSDARIIQLDCVDTLQIEAFSRALIPEQVKLFDQNRQIYVYLDKENPRLYFSHANDPNRQYLIKENDEGYWDSHNRYHHKNGYFLHQGNHLWKEYHNNKYVASFQQV
jgi:hypothetical protein